MGDAVDLDVTAELATWLDQHWDPDLTVGDWWGRLGAAGWAAPTLPLGRYGRGVGASDGVRVQEAIARYGALGAPGGLGLLLAAPTIVQHGTPEQVERLVRPIVFGQEAWCQLFSEPGAGSDLAGVTTRAVRDGDSWVVEGQKVWTSGGQVADRGMLLARTDLDAPKHRGLTYFAIDMRQPGVDVRPLREMTGRALFNEVFIEGARVDERDMVGDLNGGWAVANSTLGFERAGLSAGGGSEGAIPVTPGSRGDLDKRCGDFVGAGARPHIAGEVVAWYRDAVGLMTTTARATGVSIGPALRQALAELYTLNELGRYNGLRLKATLAAGGEIPGMPNIGKLMMSQIVRKTRDIGLQVLGAHGTLFRYDREHLGDHDLEAPTDAHAMIAEMALFAQAPPIYGGTDQIQRNILSERALGLPREPNDERTTPFRLLAKNG
jgi:alkylation response protein AidB-like acyl-CoA dehydrogenase